MSLSIPHLRRPRSAGGYVVALLGAVVAGIGVVLAAGGLRLIALDGSWYYLPAGVGLIGAGVLLAGQSARGVWLYAAVFAATLLWAVAEVGFDGWALVPRVAGPAVLFVPILLALFAIEPRGARRRAGVGTAAAVALLALGAGYGLHVATSSERPADPRFQTGFGPFPEQVAHAYHGRSGEDWPHFGADQGGSRYSALSAITPDNVSRLQVAWSVDVGEMPGTSATPLKVGDTLYVCNNRNEIFALDAATGAQRWTHDASNGYGGTCRGVAFHRAEGHQGLCATRILSGTSTARLLALDAQTGAPCPDFGNNGIVDLRVGMADVDGRTIVGYYRATSAPTVVRGRVVIGGWVTDNQFQGEPSGVVRAFDAVTGDLAWAWDMGRPDRTGTPPDGESYTTGTPNSWAPMSADEALGMVYLPTGNAGPDFFGGQRRDVDDRYSSSVVALDADSGRPVWSFQTVHHDLWDYDVPSQPTLLDLRDGQGRLRKALVQPTKQGEVYVLDRTTGEPIFEVTEHGVPRDGAVPEERVSPTQPFSDRLPSFRGPLLREADMWGVSPIDQMMCRIEFRKLRYQGPHTPPGLTPSLLYPSTVGAINWGSVSIDPVHGVMVVNSNRMAGTVGLLSRAEATAQGAHRQGEFGNPVDLLGLVPQDNTPYAATVNFWLSPLGNPCFAPPYGLLSAVDLNSGRLLWTQSFGTALHSNVLGMGFPLAIPMGVPNFAGSLVTGTGLVFIGASLDGFFHAYDLRTGRQLWRTQLPAAGGSAPISYTAEGRQYIVISAGGSIGFGSRLSTKMVAFALP